MPRTDPDRAALTSSAGYTLVELTIVITVLGILSATIGPRFFTQSVFSQRGYADELASALRQTQKAAVISNCHARLTLSASAYVAAQQAASGNGCNTSDATWATPLLGVDGAAIANSAPASTTAGPTGVFEFDTQGRLAASPGTTITIGARTITIDANTGFVQVQ
jgi:prepilin-type N-terminal cleavage/methylation domain-containing protein